MKYAHKNERILMGEYVKKKRETFPDITCEDNGADNSGEVIFDADKTSKKADFKITINGNEYLIEVKNCPVSYKASFKVEDLNAYTKYAPDNFSIVVFVGTDMWVEDNKKPHADTKFFRIRKSQIPLLKKLASYNENKGGKSFGGKPIYVLKEKYFNRFIGPERLYD